MSFRACVVFIERAEVRIPCREVIKDLCLVRYRFRVPAHIRAQLAYHERSVKSFVARFEKIYQFLACRELRVGILCLWQVVVIVVSEVGHLLVACRGLVLSRYAAGVLYGEEYVVVVVVLHVPHVAERERWRLSGDGLVGILCRQPEVGAVGHRQVAAVVVGCRSGIPSPCEIHFGHQVVYRPHGHASGVVFFRQCVGRFHAFQQVYYIAIYLCLALARERSHHACDIAVRHGHTSELLCQQVVVKGFEEFRLVESFLYVAASRAFVCIVDDGVALLYAVVACLVEVEQRLVLRVQVLVCCQCGVGIVRASFLVEVCSADEQVYRVTVIYGPQFEIGGGAEVLEALFRHEIFFRFHVRFVFGIKEVAASGESDTSCHYQCRH